MTNFKVVDRLGLVYEVYSINFHMAAANPTIQFCMWSVKDLCWMVDDAANYRPLEEGELTE